LRVRTLFASALTGGPTFLIPNAFMQDLPNQLTETMADCADRLCMPESRNESAINDREDCAFGPHGGVGRLVQHTSHLTVTMRGAVAVIDAGALFVAGTRADPRGEMFGRWKRRGRGTDFGDDLLRGIHAQPGAFGQSLHRDHDDGCGLIRWQRLRENWMIGGTEDTFPFGPRGLRR